MRIEGERIVAVGAGTRPAATPTAHRGGARHTDLGGLTLAPGFVDLHCHGGGGASFTDGAVAAERVRQLHLAHGTTSIMASLVTDRVERLADQIHALAELVTADLLLGVHLEGPWLATAYAGAHDRGRLRAPSPEQARRLLDIASGAVRMVTLAPELDADRATTSLLRERGVVVAIGHTEATYAQTRATIDAGARVITHVFNAHRPMHHREPGPALAGLADPRVVVELIADGVHVHPAIVRDTLLTRPARVALVTDAMAAAGVGDGDHRLGPLHVSVRDGVARISGLPDGREGPIAGSTLTLDRAIRYAVQAAGVDLATALRAATTTPADVLGRRDLGRIESGARADLVGLDDTLTVRAVLRGGQWALGPTPDR